MPPRQSACTPADGVRGSFSRRNFLVTERIKLSYSYTSPSRPITGVYGGRRHRHLRAVFQIHRDPLLRIVRLLDALCGRLSARVSAVFTGSPNLTAGSPCCVAKKANNWRVLPLFNIISAFFQILGAALGEGPYAVPRAIFLPRAVSDLSGRSRP